MTKEIALLLDYNDNFAKTVVDGVARYSKHSQWRFMTYRGVPTITFDQLQSWQGDGVIGYLFPEAVALLAKHNIPAVNVKTDFKDVPSCSVLADNYQIGLKAADYLVSKGFRRFVYAKGPIQGECARLKYNGFTDRLEDLAYPCSELEETKGSIIEIYNQDPKSTLAVLAAEDFVGRMVIESCADLGLRIPEDVAVLGVNNSPFICDMLYPQMSSISLGAERIGYRAASLLDDLMHGQKSPEKPIVIAPEDVVERQSTELVKLEDRVVPRALNYIKANTHRAISVNDVAREIGCGRRTLEKRFQLVLKRSPLAQIRRLRVLRACELLRETDANIEHLSSMCGYHSRDRFNVDFKRIMNMTPSKYRKQYRFAKHA